MSSRRADIKNFRLLPVIHEGHQAVPDSIRSCFLSMLQETQYLAATNNRPRGCTAAPQPICDPCRMAPAEISFETVRDTELMADSWSYCSYQTSATRTLGPVLSPGDWMRAVQVCVYKPQT